MTDHIELMRRLCEAVEARELQPMNFGTGRKLYSALREVQQAIAEADAARMRAADDYHGSDSHA